MDYWSHIIYYSSNFDQCHVPQTVSTPATISPVRINGVLHFLPFQKIMSFWFSQSRSFCCIVMSFWVSYYFLRILQQLWATFTVANILAVFTHSWMEKKFTKGGYPTNGIWWIEATYYNRCWGTRILSNRRDDATRAPSSSLKRRDRGWREHER